MLSAPQDVTTNGVTAGALVNVAARLAGLAPSVMNATDILAAFTEHVTDHGNACVRVAGEACSVTKNSITVRRILTHAKTAENAYPWNQATDTSNASVLQAFQAKVVKTCQKLAP